MFICCSHCKCKTLGKITRLASGPLYNIEISFSSPLLSSLSFLFFSIPSHFVVMLKVRYASLRATGAPVAQLVKRWPTDLADRIRSSLEVKSSQP